MIFVQTSGELSGYLNSNLLKDKLIGFVPTMGALHNGHLSLIHAARKKCDFVVCSVFVNPTQFNNPEDLRTYPRTIENDRRMLEEAGCDLLFYPSADEVYKGDYTLESSSGYGNFIHVLEGEKRPGHFDGVVTVLTKLFDMVLPDEVFFGQKDYQQCLVVKELIRRKYPHIHFNMCEIVREADGLAMSSRNVRLSQEERDSAPEIFRNLNRVARNWNSENWRNVLTEAQNSLESGPFHLDYLVVCEPDTLDELTSFKPEAIILAAVYLGKTRLIDNLMLDSGLHNKS